MTNQTQESKYTTQSGTTVIGYFTNISHRWNLGNLVEYKVNQFKTFAYIMEINFKYDYEKKKYVAKYNLDSTKFNNGNFYYNIDEEKLFEVEVKQ
jgi:hypothetical protein